MGKIVKEKYPDLEQEDQEGIRQRVIAAMNITQKAKENVNNNFIKDQLGQNPNTGLIDGIRKFVTDVSDLNIDLIDKISDLEKPISL